VPKRFFGISPTDPAKILLTMPNAETQPTVRIQGETVVLVFGAERFPLSADAAHALSDHLFTAAVMLEQSESALP